jgi:hypothetical protein
MTTNSFDEHLKFVSQTGILKTGTMWYAAGKSDFVLHVIDTILGCYQEPRSLENWLAWFYLLGSI